MPSIITGKNEIPTVILYKFCIITSSKIEALFLLYTFLIRMSVKLYRVLYYLQTLDKPVIASEARVRQSVLWEHALNRLFVGVLKSH